MKSVKPCLISLFLMLVLVFGLVVPAGAATLPEPDADVYASRYFRDYRASIKADGSGKVTIKGTVYATHSMTKLGVTKITVYESGKTTPVGTYTTGWLRSNVSSASATVTHQGTAGKSYYATVTFYAQDENGSETKTRTSSSVTAT